MDREKTVRGDACAALQKLSPEGQGDARLRPARSSGNCPVAALYVRYDGEVGTGTDNHVLSAGLRMTW